jgi:hypothetical protein
VSDERRDDLTADERALLARAAAAAPRVPARRSVGARLSAWWARPAPIALSLGLLTALLLFTLQPVERRPEFASLDDAMLGARLDLLEHYRVVERLDLFEELDVIRQLDHLPSREG